MTGLPSRIRRLAALGACASAVLGVPLLAAPTAVADTLYGCTKALQTSAVPSGENLAIVTLEGASGGDTDNDGEIADGGDGEQLVADVPVSGGETLDVQVGCQGGQRDGGYNGGGNGGVGGSLAGAGGGGDSYVAPAGGSSSNLYAIAGGGGGAGAYGGSSASPYDGSGGTGGNAEQNGTSGGDDIAGSAPEDPNDGPGGGGGAGNTGGHAGLAVGDYANIGDGYAGGSLIGGQAGAADGGDGGGGGGGGGLIQGRFAPDASASGAQTASLSLPSNASSGTATVPLTGTAQTPADSSVTPSSHDFDAVTDGRSGTETFTVTDTGQVALTIGQLSESGGEFALVSGQDGCSGQTIAEGQTCTFQVSFAPISSGVVSGSVEVPSNAYSAPAAFVNLSGTGQTPVPRLSLGGSTESYGAVAVGQSDTKTVTVTNSGQADLTVGQATVTGPDADEFSIVSGQDGCSGRTLASGGTCTIAVAFSPTSGGARSASLSLPSNDPVSPTTVALSGSGQATTSTPTPPTPTPPVTAPPAPPSTGPSKPPGLALVERLVSVGRPTARALFSHGEKVRVHCNRDCSVSETLTVYHRALARGRHYRALLHADMAAQPWTRVRVAHTVVTMPKAGYRTVSIKLKPGPRTVLSYAGSILLGVVTTPTGKHAPVSTRWVTVSGPDMNARVRAR